MDVKNKIELLISEARSAQQRGELDDSMDLCSRALNEIEIAMPSNESKVQDEYLVLQARVLNQQANVAAIRGLNKDAIALYTQVLHCAETLHQPDLQVACLCNLGNVYTQILDYNRADEYLHQALGLATEHNLELYRANILCNLASSRVHIQDYDAALQYLDSSLNQYRKLADRHGEVLVLTNIASVWASRDCFEECVGLYEEALQISEEIGDKGNMIMALHSLGQVYQIDTFRLYNTQTAQHYFEQALELSVEMQSLSSQTYITQSLSLLHRQQEQWKLALEYFERYHELTQQTNSVEVQQMAQKHGYERRVALREKELEIQRAQSSTTRELLHRLLPAVIADRMMEDSAEIADYLPCVSILFADIKGFTPMSATMPAQLIVRVLDSIFSVFDRIVKEHGCEKIKTIGDGYMAVAGAPTPCDDHAERLAKAAQEMLRTLKLPEEAKSYLPDHSDFGVRIGLHCGAVVAGVVGRERFVYDMYSDAVNLASRLESHGIAGKIHCSEEFVQELAKSDASFRVVARGPIELKGKGILNTFFIE